MWSVGRWNGLEMWLWDVRVVMEMFFVAQNMHNYCAQDLILVDGLVFGKVAIPFGCKVCGCFASPLALGGAAQFADIGRKILIMGVCFLFGCQ